MSEKVFVDLKNIETVRSSSEEAETIITVERLEKDILIYSSDNVMITKIARAARKNPSAWQCWEGSRTKDGKLHGYFFSAPRNVLTFRSGIKKEYTEEQHAERVARGKALAQARGFGGNK